MFESLPAPIGHLTTGTSAGDLSRRAAWRDAGILLACLAVAIYLWLLALPAIDPDRMTDRGLVSVLPPTFFLSLALISAGFAWQVSYGRTTGFAPYLYLAALVVILHATPPLVYGTLRYSWAWKHLGIVDYIQRHGGVDPATSPLAAYHNWPGLFVVTAWLADRFGMRSVELASVVQFTPPVLTLAFLAAYLWLMRLFTDDRRLQLTAGWFFVVANWVGQDYFSPQGVTFLCYIMLLALFLGPLRRSDAAWASRRPGFLNVLGAPAAAPGLQPWTGSRLSRVLATVLALALILVIVVTHQLTPLMLILAAAALVGFGWLAPSYLAFAIVAEAIWLLWGAAPFVYQQAQSEIAALGAFSQAVSKLADVALVSPDRAWVVQIGRAFSAAVVLVGLVGGLRRLFKGYWDFAALALLLAPAPMIAVAYGGESLFRVYLFTLPFLAFFAGAAFFPSPASGRSAFVFPLLAAACLLSTAGFLVANNGKDRDYRFTPEEVAVAEWLYTNAPAGSLLIEGARNYPSQFLNYENFSYLPISEEDAEARERIIADPAGALSRWMDDPRRRDAYVILTRSQKNYLEAGGYMPPGDFDKIEAGLLASSRFIVVRGSSNAKVFKFLPATPEGGGLDFRPR